MSTNDNNDKQAGTRELREIFGDTKPRSTCVDCGHIDYDNPKVVVGAVTVADDGRLLLCRRAIEPRKGYWDIPEGFLEGHETTADGAIREALEEVGAQIKIDGLLGIYEIPHGNTIKMIYRAKMLTPSFCAGEECHEARLFEWKDIPWNDLAFYTVRDALVDYQNTKDQETPVPAHKIQERPSKGTIPRPKNEP